MLSVILKTYDGFPMTCVHIRECMNSTVIPDEIVVVNDGGDPSLRDSIYAMPRKCPIVYVRINEDIPWNVMGAENLGVWLSKGDILALEDNDHIPHPEFYKLALKELENQGVDRVLAKYRLCTTLSEVLSKPLSEWQLTPRGRPTHRLVGMYRRDLFLKVKGRDEKFAGLYGWEGIDWQNRIRRAESTGKQAGYYYLVVDGETKGYEKVHYSRNPKNQKEAYQHLRRNNRANRTQSEKGILNFTYEFERL